MSQEFNRSLKRMDRERSVITRIFWIMFSVVAMGVVAWIGVVIWCAATVVHEGPDGLARDAGHIARIFNEAANPK